MAFHDDAHTMIVVGKWQNPDGSPARGYIEVQLNQSTADTNINVIYTQKKMRYELDGNGEIEIELIKTGSGTSETLPLSRNVALKITENLEGGRKITWNTIVNEDNIDGDGKFQLADAAETTVKPMNQYVLLGTYSAGLATKASTSYVDSAVASRAPTNNPTFTGTVSGVTKAHVGLNNADNTSDANKPVSTAQATAIGLKANTASPTFTGTVTTPNLIISTGTAPSTITSTGTKGQIAYDTGYLYICIATNIWRRVALTTW